MASGRNGTLYLGVTNDPKSLSLAIFAGGF
jgi:hypothetical protein